jgi:aldose 1-epimerase
MTAAPMILRAGDAVATIHPDQGGRLGSLTIDGLELLVTHSPDGPIRWGSYPMAPWAGRTRVGTFTFNGREHHLPITMPPHAIHGVVYDRPWTVTGDGELAIDLDERWPFRGRVTQRFHLEEDALELTMAVEAQEPMPAVIGWHPWFRKALVEGDEDVRLRFEPRTMLLRGADGIPTGERIPPTKPPWDDAFTDLASEPVLDWPGRLRLTVSSTCRWWVVYTEPWNAVCVEPQSGPPDALNSGADVVHPGVPLVHAMHWHWTRPDDRG